MTQWTLCTVESYRHSVVKSLCNEAIQSDSHINDAADYATAMDRDIIHIIDARETHHSRAFLLVHHTGNTQVTHAVTVMQSQGKQGSE